MPTRDPNEIRHEIERTREEIASSIATLRSSVTEATDWRTYVKKQPFAFIGGAFAIGLFVGLR